MLPLAIFKPGRHTAVNGKVIEFSDAQLQASAAAYKPELHEAPLVVGHPAVDAPAYGWAKALSFAGGVLHAEPHQVDGEFAAMVNGGRFKKISASFYEPDAPGNPVPGVYYLRHIGFLGAAAPSVRGLKSASFAGGDKGIVEFSDWGDSIVATLFRSIRDAWIAKFGKDEADKIIPDYSVTALTERAAKGDAMTSTSYAAPAQETLDMETPEQKTARLAAEAKLNADKDQLAADRLAFAARETALRASEAIAARAATVEFVGSLVKAGQILPRDEAGLVAYMAGPNEAGVIEFSEGDKKHSPKAGEWLKQFLAGLPKQVDYTERTPRADAAAASVSFAAPHGYNVDPARLELHNKALEYQKAHAGTEYLAAVAAVSH